MECPQRNSYCRVGYYQSLFLSKYVLYLSIPILPAPQTARSADNGAYVQIILLSVKAIAITYFELTVIFFETCPFWLHYLIVCPVLKSLLFPIVIVYGYEYQ